MRVAVRSEVNPCSVAASLPRVLVVAAERDGVPNVLLAVAETGPEEAPLASVEVESRAHFAGRGREEKLR
jgi:hypothetical protein